MQVNRLEFTIFIIWNLYFFILMEFDDRITKIIIMNEIMIIIMNFLQIINSNILSIRYQYLINEDKKYFDFDQTP